MNRKVFVISLYINVTTIIFPRMKLHPLYDIGTNKKGRLFASLL